MRAYSKSDEENVRDQSLVREWINSGFLLREQGPVLQADLSVPLRRTNGVLRAVLAFFTTIVVIAAALLTTLTLHLKSTEEPLVPGIWAAICLGLALLLVRKGRFYRCGAEEMLGVMAVAFFALSLGSRPWDRPALVGLLAGALGSVAVYVVFGFRYAIVASTVLAGIAPFALNTNSIAERAMSVAIFAAIFLLARRLQHLLHQDITEGDFIASQAAAFIGVYAGLNLVLTNPLFYQDRITSGWIYWSSYVMVWAVPALAVWRGIRERQRFLINAGWLSALVTILTNKTYLGWTRQTWDPIVLGLFLMATASILRRWLAKGPNGERSGFTPVRVLASENRSVAIAGALSLAVPHPSIPGPTQTAQIKPGGGESGGGGASGSF